MKSYNNFLYIINHMHPPTLTMRFLCYSKGEGNTQMFKIDKQTDPILYFSMEMLTQAEMTELNLR